MARTQEKFQRRLATQVRNNRERFIEFFQQALTAHGEKPGLLSREDLSQMMEGFTAVVNEALQGRSNEVRTFYVEAVIPGLVRKGLSPDKVVQTMTTWAKSSQQFIQKDLESAPDNRDAIRWLEGFFGAVLAEIQRTARTPGDPPVKSDFFAAVVANSGLAPVIGQGVVRRACDMTGIEAERLTPAHLREMIPVLRKGMNLFLSGPDAIQRVKRLEGMLPRVEEPAPV